FSAPTREPCGVFGAFLGALCQARAGGSSVKGAVRGDPPGLCAALRVHPELGGLAEEDLLNDVCREVVERWSDSQVVDSKEEKEDEVQAIASMMEKQARIVVKPKEVSQEEKQRKAALLAQYANVTDEEEYPFPDGLTTAVNIGSEKSLFRNTNVEDVLNARKLERELLRDEFQKKKEQDKLQREKDKLAKQERKEKEKKRTQKGERKR
uniref:Coiled-coil domain containing 43 n=1 Tax=Serinus canaria TaxID=9135 RepID=A0A8C9N217_SERCA